MAPALRTISLSSGESPATFPRAQAACSRTSGWTEPRSCTRGVTALASTITRVLHSINHKYLCLRVDISVMVVCYASDTIGHDRRRTDLSNATLYVKQNLKNRQ